MLSSGLELKMDKDICAERAAARPDDIGGMEEMYNGGFGTQDMQDIYK